jgi:hypothetical protein
MLTQIKADYPEATAIGGQHGVNYAREKGSYQADLFPLLKSRTGGKQGIKVEVRRDGRKGGDETREGGVGLFHGGNAVQLEPDRQAALQCLPQAFNTSFGLGASGGDKLAS